MTQIAWVKIIWSKYKKKAKRTSIVLVIPIMLILLSSFLKLKIETFLFIAAGISNLIVFADINKELCKDASQKEPLEFITLYAQSIIFAAIIGFSFSLIFQDCDIGHYLRIFLLLGIFVIVLSSYFLINKNIGRGNYLLYSGLILITIFIWADFTDLKSENVGAIIHLLVIPWVFYIPDKIMSLITTEEKEKEKLREFVRLDFGLVVVGMTTYIAAKESMIYFQAGSAAAMLIIGNYFYLIISGDNSD